MNIGDMVSLVDQVVKVCSCEKCGVKMVNIDENEMRVGDLTTLKSLGLRISNPATKDPICLECEIEREDTEHTFKRKVSSFFHSSNVDDSSFHSSEGGFSFGGFGGGMFSGGGASGGF